MFRSEDRKLGRAPISSSESAREPPLGGIGPRRTSVGVLLQGTVWSLCVAGIEDPAVLIARLHRNCAPAIIERRQWFRCEAYQDLADWLTGVSPPA